MLKKIGLLGPFGYGNLGDAAIQDAIIQHIRNKISDAEIYGYSFNPDDTSKRHGITSFPIMRDLDVDAGFRNRLPNSLRYRVIVKLFSRLFIRYPAEVRLTVNSYQNLKGLDALIFSGGGQLDDYWGGPWQYPYTIFKWTFLARLRRVRVYFVSVGAGPIEAKLSRFFIRLALRLARYRSYRDDSSKKYIIGIGFPAGGDPVYPDLAYSLDWDSTSSRGVDRPLDVGVDMDVQTVGIGPMAFFDPRVWPERDLSIYLGYLDKLATFISWMIARRTRVILIPGGLSQDTRPIEDLKQALVQKGMIDTELLLSPPIESVEDLLTVISRMDIVVASRLHSVILSHLCHKPVLAISYHNKIDVLMQDLGQSKYCLNIRSFSPDDLVGVFQDLEENRGLICNQIVSRVGMYRKELEHQYGQLFG